MCCCCQLKQCLIFVYSVIISLFVETNYKNFFFCSYCIIIYSFSFGHNDRLHDLRHTSSTAVTEFILLISDHLSDRIVSEIKLNPCCAIIVDDPTDTYYYFATIHYIYSICQFKRRTQQHF